MSPAASSPPPPLSQLYAAWGAIGASILLQFALLLYLQRAGVVEISDRGGPLGPQAHVGLAAALFVAAVVLVRGMRARARTAGRTFALSIASWAVAEALAVAGLAVALALAPAPRLALIVYFTGALFLWLRSRP